MSGRWRAEKAPARRLPGLELSPRLPQLARRRLPESAGRIALGNVLDWSRALVAAAWPRGGRYGCSNPYVRASVGSASLAAWRSGCR